MPYIDLTGNWLDESFRTTLNAMLKELFDRMDNSDESYSDLKNAINILDANLNELSINTTPKGLVESQENNDMLAEIQNFMKLILLPPVNTFQDLPEGLPKGSTIMVRDTGKSYRMTNGAWMEIQELGTKALNIISTAATVKSYPVISDMKGDMSIHVGEFCRTSGYYESGDCGSALYKIMTKETFLSLLPEDLKREGYDPINFVDEYGNHTLNNGLVARIIKEANTIKPEQFGAKGDGVSNDTLPFIHLYGHIKKGKIELRAGAKYYFDDIWPIFNPYKKAILGTPLGGYHTSKPVLGNVDGLIIEGNHAEYVTAPNGFAKSNRYDVDFSNLILGGHINNLTIRNLHIIGNAFTQDISLYRTNNRNHGIAFIGAHFGNASFPVSAPFNSLKNFIVEDCSFTEMGGMNAPVNDYGGDGILLLAPRVVENHYFRRNKFIDVGRWAIAYDLSSQNIQGKTIFIENNYMELRKESIPKEPKRQIERNLGFLDFEINISWDNLVIKDNTVIAGSFGIAMGGGSNAQSKNIYIENNRFTSRTDKTMGYWYFLMLYNQDLENVHIRKNNIFYSQTRSDNTITFGRSVENLYIEDNSFEVDKTSLANFAYIGDSTEIRAGKITFKNNKIIAPRGLVLINPKVGDAQENVNVFITSNDFDKVSKGYLLYLFNHEQINCYDYFKFTIKDNIIRDWEVNTVDCEGIIIYDEPYELDNNALSQSLPYQEAYLPPKTIGAYIAQSRFESRWENPIDVLYGKYKVGFRPFKHLNGANLIGTNSFVDYVCTKEGAAVSNIISGSYTQYLWSSGITVATNTIYEYDNKLYIATNAGTSGTIPPTHTNGIASDGAIKWRFYDNRAEFSFFTGVFNQKVIKSSNIPVSGRWNKSDIVYHSNPVKGGNVGWICTTSGNLTNIIWKPTAQFSSFSYIAHAGNIYRIKSTGTSGINPPTHTSGEWTDDAGNTWLYYNEIAVFHPFGLIG